MLNPAVQPYRWTRQQYERMAAAGVFHPEARLQLIDGVIVDMTPQGSFHATAIGLVERALRTPFATGYYIRVQMPLALDDTSEPEPDIAVVTGSPRDDREAHPDTAVLVVEVADATLAFDRGRKKRLYARNAMPEYWIINLVEGHLEVYRDPQKDNFASKTALCPEQSVSPVAAPNSKILVADLLP